MSVKPKRPNILFFFADDQRFDTIGALGNPHIHTPTLDWLVERGTAFTHAHIMGGSCRAVCMPSRAMLMTGRTLWHLEREGQDIPAEHIQLGEALRAAGYATFGTGKWHNGPDAYARSFSHGGEIFFGGMDDHWNVPACDFRPDGNYPEPRDLARDLEVQFDEHNRPARRHLERPQCYDHLSEGRHSSDLFADAACRFIEEHEGDEPFFAYVSFMAPHDPRETHPRFRDLYDDTEIPLPENFAERHSFDNGELDVRDEKLAPMPRTPEDTRRQIADYYAMITHLDSAIAQVLSALDRAGQTDNTIIVFAGDNGLAVGRHGLFGKQSLYEHSVRVPLLFAGPGIPADERRDALCYLIDIYPTLCDLVGVDTPDSVEGQSLARAISRGVGGRDFLPLAYRGLHRGVREERMKLIEYVVDGERTTQLFDVQTDPDELNNLAGDPAHADDLARLRGELQVWRTELDDTRDFGQQFWSGYDAGA